MDVSILTACLGDYRPIVKAIKSYKTKHSYEIHVSGAKLYDEVKDDINFLPDPGTSVKAYNQMFKKSKGKYIFCFAGTVIPPSNMFDMIEELKRQEMRGNQLIVSSMTDDVGGICLIPPWAAELANLKERPQILRWPCFSRKTLTDHFNGVIFNEHFKHHWVDNWLPTYCKLFGEEKRQVQHVRIKTIPHVSVRDHDDHDLKVYQQLIKQYKNNKSYNFNPLENIDED